MRAVETKRGVAGERCTVADGRLPRFRPVMRRWRELLIALRSIHGLVEGQFPLVEGLVQLSKDAPSRSLSHIFYWLHAELQRGVPLHVAMGNRPDFFPPFCVDLIRAGEDGGQLAAALGDVVEEIQEALACRRALFGQLWLFGYGLFAPMLFAAGIMAFVSPQIATIRDQFGGTPTWSMTLVQWLHDIGLFNFLVIAAVAIPAVLLAAELSNVRGGKLARNLAALFTWLPGWAAYSKKRHLASAASMLGRLLRAGAPLPSALRSVADFRSSGPCAHELYELALKVEAGHSLREALDQRRKFFPPSFRTLVALGESSGQLPDAFAQIGAQYRSQVQTRARLAIELGGPALVCLNGFLVFIIYGGLLSSVFGLADLVR